MVVASPCAANCSRRSPPRRLHLHPLSMHFRRLSFCCYYLLCTLFTAPLVTQSLHHSATVRAHWY